MVSQKCPYCKKKLEKILKRKAPCSHCGKDIYVRSGELMTKDEMICIDAIKRMEYLEFLDLDLKDNKNLNALWVKLQMSLAKFSELDDYKKISSILLHMGIIAEMEGNYKNCIRNYFLSAYFDSLERIQRYKKTGSEITLEDLMEVTSFMIASPVIKSIKALNLEGVNPDSLEKLALTTKLSIDEKLDILNDFLAGNNKKLVNINFDNT